MNSAIKVPELLAGEIYVGAIIKKDGNGHHIILLPGDKNLGNWKDAMDWAKENGGDLPNRIEQSLLFAEHKTEFEKDWYWSNTTHTNNSEWAWCQLFSYGNQDSLHKSRSYCRARAVRRISVI